MLLNIKKNKSTLYTIGYWVFALGMGTILIYIEPMDDIEPVFSILAFHYWMLLIYWTARWVFRQIKSVLKQKEEKNRVELLHLQSQVNPHFFFNTLNNLYGLVDKDTKKAQELILKLSDMMRYSIYDGQNEKVSLSEEINYLKNYIELHKMRYHKAIDIEFNHDVKDNDYRVMPLLFIMLLENAFKHGVENLRENAYVYIHLNAKNHQVQFDIENNFEVTNEPENKGIGLQNLKRRLALGYPKQHHLSFSKLNGVYKAQLTIKIVG